MNAEMQLININFGALDRFNSTFQIAPKIVLGKVTRLCLEMSRPLLANNWQALIPVSNTPALTQ